MPYGQFYPGTTNQVTHSYQEAEYTAEFDDALLDQAAWKNSRYDGSKLTSKYINKFTPSSSTYVGDESWGNLPVLSNQTTALYIANTVVGYKENLKYADIKNHSYVGINKILIINHVTDTVQIIDKAVEPFEEFHRFITNDLPTGKKVTTKIIDESIATNLKGNHRVKMNKGWLLKSFDFNFAGEQSGSEGVLSENNAMYLYKGGTSQLSQWLTGSVVTPPVAAVNQNGALRFRFALNEMFPASTSSGEYGHKFGIDRIGPSFASSSFIENKFTQQYYSGSYGLIKNQPVGSTYADILLSSGLGSASKFIAIDALSFLDTNISNPNLTEQEKTEIHITFFEGTKDFSKGVSSSVSAFDERSISTFEIDQNRAQLDIKAGDGCNGGLPVNYEFVFKGMDDSRFMPKLHTYFDDIQSAHLQSTASNALSASLGIGCTALNSTFSGSNIQSGVTVDRFESLDITIQGGALGQQGFDGAYSSSVASAGFPAPYNLNNPNYGTSNISKMTTDNFYSGSFNYQMSFLDKDHTLIMDIDKDYELQDGIGIKGLVIIPEHSHPQVSFNLEYFLQKAGIIGPNPGQTTQNISNNVIT
tara:strand:- start:3697 stop:5460 length:1764 start_codon:yes stop_codon:yes gene_type:complete